jgi:hypothetical protein
MGTSISLTCTFLLNTRRAHKYAEPQLPCIRLR